jgi:hypothetical protein
VGVRTVDSRSIEADLVVDATGRAHRARQWLAAIGFSSPEETEIGLDTAFGICAFCERASSAPPEFSRCARGTLSGDLKRSIILFSFVSLRICCQSLAEALAPGAPMQDMGRLKIIISSAVSCPETLWIHDGSWRGARSVPRSERQGPD